MNDFRKGVRDDLIANRVIVNDVKPSVNDSSVYIYAARYAHNRNTGAAMQVVNAILQLWDRFNYVDQQQLKREAKEAAFNIEDWQRILDR